MLKTEREVEKFVLLVLQVEREVEKFNNRKLSPRLQLCLTHENAQHFELLFSESHMNQDNTETTLLSQPLQHMTQICGRESIYVGLQDS